MVNDIIRKGVDGFELNFGPLVIVEVAGVRAAVQDWRAKQLGLTIVEQAEGEELPEFLDDLKLVMQYAIAQIDVYPFDRADVKTLGKALSEIDTLGDYPNRVDVSYMSRILMMWEQGTAIGEPRAIEDFYDGLTVEQIERGRF